MTGEAQGTTVQPPGSGQRWWRCRYCSEGRTFVGTVEQEAREATSHEASCPQRPQPWTCPTPILDLSKVEWTMTEVPPGTPYPDEDTETIPPGVYVLGYFPGDDDVAPLVLHVVDAYDEHGCDRARDLGAHVLNRLFTHRAESPSDSTFTRVFASPARQALALARAKGWLR